MKNAVAALVVAVTLSGCASLMPAPQPPVALVTPWVAEDYKGWEGEGDSVVRGQAFLRQKGGGVVTCAGQAVALVPDTDYYREAVGIMLAGRKVAPTGRDTSYLRRLTTCDAQGRFEFANVPAQPWMIATEVSWMVGYAKQGGPMLKSIHPEKGKTLEVMLTDSDRR